MQYDYEAYSTDLIFYHSGAEVCKPSHSYGPAIRDHYLIHFIINGKGIYKVGDKIYELSKGNAFLICPNVITYYKADKEKPWSYMWVGFNGQKAKDYLQKANLDHKNLIFNFKNDSIQEILKQLNNCNQLSVCKDFNLLGYLYLLLGKMIEESLNIDNEKEIKNNYVEEAIIYIKANYSRNITIIDIAKYLSLNRSYLYILFQQQLRTSPQQYLIEYRINKACELMESTRLTISQISRSVGYNDPLMFSKIFKKYKGLSPKYYRNSIQISEKK
ncbi:AraC family transcriptional regulator [Vallitalea guaymasensis]|uniref:AraC family transcriptional regulator n=1 Tax=Vallitalea guaymasensis TaxID=1185412 RepID=UPI00272CB41B|nr:AraC family transcriptional regulator [Vallitalea guaymasensis]